MDAQLENARTIALVSYRKNGTEVATPVTPVVLDGKLLAISMADAWKVKRIGRDPRVKVAPCTMRGRVLGPFHAGTAQVVSDPTAAERVRSALEVRYGMLAKISNWFARRWRRHDRRVVLVVTV